MKNYPSWDRQTRIPSRLPPAGACDSQVHVYGDPARYPVRPGTAYDPPDATFDDVLTLHRTLGIERGLIVQATCYGTDHRLLIEALARGEGRYRGCAIIDDSVSGKELLRLHEAGVRGARFNFAKALKIAITPESFKRSVERIAELGWFAKIFTLEDEFAEYAPLFEALRLPVVVDHMGGLDFGKGLHQPGMEIILKFLKKGNWWVMVSSGDRHSITGFPWSDAIPFARSFIDAAPDRVVWGTDWPHVIYDGKMPNDTDLLELFYRYAPEDELRRQILVENPARLFGFELPKP